MILSTLIRKGGLASIMTATPATPATVDKQRITVVTSHSENAPMPSRGMAKDIYLIIQSDGPRTRNQLATALKAPIGKVNKCIENGRYRGYFVPHGRIKIAIAGREQYDMMADSRMYQDRQKERVVLTGDAAKRFKELGGVDFLYAAQSKPWWRIW